MFEPNTQKALDVELSHADQARLSGNEGMARVCARRAAGIAVRAYFLQKQMDFSDPSAFAVLTRLNQLDSTPADIRSIADDLLMRVTPNYQLPISTDLTAQAKRLIDWVAEQIEGDRLD